MPRLFITAIDTDAGKSVITGLIARHIKQAGKSVITVKLAQTGCSGIADDIELHRDIMGTEILEEDRNGTTCPYVFKHPASPHLSAGMEGRTIDTDLILQNIASLEEKYDYVLIEGAGGLQVPITEDYTILDFITDNNFPTVLVSCPKLGSINHTLLSLECMANRKIELKGLVYNQYPNSDKAITQDSENIIKKYCTKYYPQAHFTSIPVLNSICSVGFDFDGLMR